LPLIDANMATLRQLDPDQPTVLSDVVKLSAEAAVVGKLALIN
jgi:hypothetical protein